MKMKRKVLFTVFVLGGLPAASIPLDAMGVTEPEMQDSLEMSKLPLPMGS